MLHLILNYALFAIAGILLLWFFYIGVMDLKFARDAGMLTTAAKIMGYPFLFVGLAVDLIVNLTIAPVIFLDWPRETTVTGHIQRLVNGSAGWRRTLALWFAVNLLNSVSGKGSPHITIPIPLPPLPAK